MKKKNEPKPAPRSRSSSSAAKRPTSARGSKPAAKKKALAAAPKKARRSPAASARPLFIQAASKLRPQNPTRARRAVAATAAISEAEATRRQMRILNVLGSILAARASVVFAAKGWEGSISGDYRYTASDLPSMLNDVRQMLASPPGNYRFVFDQAFVQRYLGGTALELANGIYFALQ